MNELLLCTPDTSAAFYEESIKTLLTECFQDETSATAYNGPEIQHCLLFDKDYSQRVYDVFCNFITDCKQTPGGIIKLLDLYLNELDGFTINKSLQTLVAFSCLEALAIRRPGVLDGQWEKVARIIVKHSVFSNSNFGKKLTKFKKLNIATLKWLVELGSPEICPNPYLRLELFRLMRGFDRYGLVVNDFDGEYPDFNWKLFRNEVINTLFEVCENNSSFTMDEFPNLSPMDLQFILKDNCISIGFLSNDYFMVQKRTAIITVMLKITRKLVLLEKERRQKHNVQAMESCCWNYGLKYELLACLFFCGLIELILPYDKWNQDASDGYFVETIGNDKFLLDNVIHTLETISHVVLCFPDANSLQSTITQRKEQLLHIFFQEHSGNVIRSAPKHQHLREIHGGFASAAENRLSYFQNKKRYEVEVCEWENLPITSTFSVFGE